MIKQRFFFKKTKQKRSTNRKIVQQIRTHCQKGKQKKKHKYGQQIEKSFQQSRIFSQKRSKYFQKSHKTRSHHTEPTR